MRIQDLKILIKLLQIITLPKEKSLSSKEIGERFFGKDKFNKSDLRTIQRYLKDLSEISLNGKYYLVESVGEGKFKRYYHQPGNLSKWLMTEQTAHHLILAQAVLESSFGNIQELNLKQNLAQANQVFFENGGSNQLHRKLRVVPDGLGRLPAIINSKVLKDIVTAINNNRQIFYKYKSSTGELITKTVSIQGLVAKDGTIYLIGTEGFSPPERALPLQRFQETDVTPHISQEINDFNLDEYIKKTHQLSHSIDSQHDLIELILRVDPRAIYHFKERPLEKNQKIIQPTEGEKWYLVSAKIPNTILLLPFILSMGPFIEIISPEKIKSDFISHLKEINTIYNNC